MTMTKADMLVYLSSRLRRGQVLPVQTVDGTAWKTDRDRTLAQVLDGAVVTAAFAGTGCGGTGCGAGVIVRSSAVGEDSAAGSMAGQFLSVPGVTDAALLESAIDRVLDSYGDCPGAHQVLIQPMLDRVRASGVLFGCDPATGVPYRVINIHFGEDTAAVTGGQGQDLITRYHWAAAPFPEPETAEDADVAALLALVDELAVVLGTQALDLEFAFHADDPLPVLFQVRPLIVPEQPVPSPVLEGALSAIAAKVAAAMTPKPYLHGDCTVFGVMPDWNPAEIIGVRPRPLALSLYRDLVTDSIWAYQRHNYGYKNLRSFPLMIDFNGLPYIDVRVSFNSFIPADIDADLSGRLANHYLDRLIAAPALHDKVEFEIVQSCYAFDLPDRMAALPETFSAADRDTLTDSLRCLTNRIIDRDNGLWQADTARIQELERRRETILASDLETVAKIYWLLEDCKRYGTLPFAGLARAGFVAGQILRSLVRVGILTEADLQAFMGGVRTVSSDLGRDLHRLQRDAFLEIYGHLRPGTYDILSPRYDEQPDLYFPQGPSGGISDPTVPSHRETPAFALSLHQMRSIECLLDLHGLSHTVVGLFDFLEAGIRGREHAKFVFSRSLSDALSLMTDLGAQYGFDRDALSYADIGCIRHLYAASDDPQAVLADSIARGQQRYALTRCLTLPPLLTDPAQVWSFTQPQTEPNYITHRQATGPVMSADPELSLEGAIVVLTNADPGYDWIFARNIAGFITAYGGANSHMAIRANELGLPAVIGCGAVLFDRWQQARTLRLDCVNRQVTVLQ